MADCVYKIRRQEVNDEYQSYMNEEIEQTKPNNHVAKQSQNTYTELLTHDTKDTLTNHHGGNILNDKIFLKHYRNVRGCNR